MGKNTKKKKKKKKKNNKKKNVKYVTKYENGQKKIYRKKKRLKVKWRNVFLILAFTVFLGIFIYCLFNIGEWVKDSHDTSEQIEELQNTVNVNEKEDSENTEIIENDVPQSDPYWDFIKMSLIDVDFTELKASNNDTIGWIQVGGTNINYPIVQTDNNDYYLTHTFNKSFNSAGWVFMDYRNDPANFAHNTIIYAHGRYDNTMFGSLRNILSSGWLNNPSNYVIKLSTETENTLWQVFSVYRIPTTNDYIQTQFGSDEQFQNFANLLLERSSYNFGTTVSATDKILTLSTCYNDDEKVVLHAKLIKRESKA